MSDAITMADGFYKGMVLEYGLHVAPNYGIDLLFFFIIINLDVRLICIS